MITGILLLCLVGGRDQPMTCNEIRQPFPNIETGMADCLLWADTEIREIRRRDQRDPDPARVIQIPKQSCGIL